MRVICGKEFVSEKSMDDMRDAMAGEREGDNISPRP